MRKMKKEPASLQKLKQEMTKQMGRNIKEHYQDDAPYVVLNRSILEELPEETQRLFVSIIEEIENTFDLSEAPDSYVVIARGKNNNSKGGTCHVKDKFKQMCPPKFRK